MNLTSHRRALGAVCLALVLTSCSDDPEPGRDRAAGADSSAAAPSPRSSAAADAVAPSPGAPTSAPAGASVVPAPGTTTTGLPSQTSPTPVSSAAPGPAARRLATAPGRYTLDVRGTARSQAGTQPTDGQATLTVDPPRGDDQHSTLQAGQNGSSEQTVRFAADAIQLVQLRLTTPGFSKEFRPVRPVTLLPQPATVGKTWSWTVVSTDGATTASVEAKMTRGETIVIGGERVATTVVHSTLRLSGDITATTVMDTWYADRYRLVAKEHAVTDGQFQGFTFRSETTSTLRSTKPA